MLSAETAEDSPVWTVTVMILEPSLKPSTLLTGYCSGCVENISNWTISRGLIPYCIRLSLFPTIIPEKMKVLRCFMVKQWSFLFIFTLN